MSIVENDAYAIASLTLRREQGGAFAQAARSTLGLDLPRPGESVAGEPWSAFWTGPDQWFVTAPITTHEDIERRLRAAFGTSASITEQTGAWVRFDASGTHVDAMMERLTMLDFAAMAPGAATRTTIHHMNVFVLRTDEGFAFLGARSSAASLHHALATAEKSVA